VSGPTRIAIFNDSGRCLARRRNGGFELPQVDVAHDRAGLAIFRAVRDQLNLEVFCLVCAGSDELPVLRLQSLEAPVSQEFLWVEPTDIGSGLSSRAVQIQAQRDDFGGFGWYAEVSAWLEERISRLGYELVGLEQWNGRVGGVLLRVVTNGTDFWFKAVSDFNTREFKIAQMLAARHPRYFPSVVAAEPSWNALLLEHVGGTELQDHSDIEEWIAATVALAEVQMDWMGAERELLLAGAADLRPETIAAGVPAFLDHVEAAMSRQTKTTPPPLTRADLASLRPGLCRLADQTTALSLGSGLANADFSPHNTLWTSTGPRFIDWAEACVSLPLIAGEYLWNRMAIESPDRIGWRSSLRDAYLRRWAERYGMETIQRAAAIFPTFAILAVAMFFHERECNGPSVYDAYLRSLTRRLHREIKTSESVLTVSGFRGCFAQSAT
jgi:hypothetical protein